MAASAVPKRRIFIRPRSEIITVLAGRQVSCEKSQQCPSETCLDAQFFQDEEPEVNTAFICGSYEFTHDEYVTSEDETTSDAKNSTVNFAAKLQGSVLATNDPRSVKSQPEPRLVKVHSMAADLSRREEVETVESQNDKKEERSRLNRKTESSLDISLARLRHEMNSLRRQDVELLAQLLNLDNSIQEFKLSQSCLSESISNLSDTSETDFEHLEMPVEIPCNTRRRRSRGSLGSDGSDYHSISSRSSIGSNNSLAGSDLTSSDSGHESVFGLKSSMKRSKGKFGSQDMRRVSFERLKGRSGSEVFDNGSSFVFPTQAVRRNSAQFRVAELKPIQTLRKRQSTIW